MTIVDDIINAESIAEFIETLNVSSEIKTELKQITPYNYTGVLLH